MMLRFVQLACLCLLLQGLSGRVMGAEELFPSLYGTNPAKPLQVLVDQTWGREAQGREEFNSDPERPFGDSTLFLGTTVPTASQGPLKLVLDYAALEHGASSSLKDQNVRIYAVFRYPEFAGHQAQAAESRELRLSGSLTRRDMVIGGRAQTLQVEHSEQAYDLRPDTPVSVYLNVVGPSRLETHQLRARLVAGEFSLKKPRGPMLGIGSFGKRLLGAGLVILWAIWLYRLIKPRELGGDEYVPRLQGTLIFCYGTALAGVGMMDSLLYYPAVGIAVACSGCFLYLGSRAGIWCYWLALMLALGITQADMGIALNNGAVMRLGMLCLLALYIFSGAVSPRTRPD